MICVQKLSRFKVNFVIKNPSWFLANKSFGSQATTHFLRFPGLYTCQRPPSFNIKPGTVFWYFGHGINWPQLTVSHLKRDQVNQLG